MLTSGSKTDALGLQASEVAWIDVPKPVRETLDEVSRRAHLPLELVTYCLLVQYTPTILPCGAWLYCSWQAPACYPRAQWRSGAEVSLHLEELKVCLGPRELDVACNEIRSRALGRTAEDDAFLLGYGEHDAGLVDVLVHVQTLVLAAWTFALAERQPEFAELAVQRLEAAADGLGV